MTVRVNLLPREIIEKRRFEHRMVYVFVVGGVCAFLVVAVWLVLVVQVQGKRDLLQTEEQRAAKALQQAESYAVFEERELALNERVAIAEEALAERVDWGRMTNELSLVLPDDAWFGKLTASEGSGLQIDGYVLDTDDEVHDLGFKSIAKTLVRLASLEQVTDVWLTKAVKMEDADSGEPYVQFTITAAVSLPKVSEEAGPASASAPPPPAPVGN